MHFEHAKEIWSEYPELVAGVVSATGITGNVSVGSQIAKFTAIAEARLADASEAEFPEIQAWRRAFSRMGLKPTQYRCASEALLRRFRKERSLPQVHPLIDLCNAISLAYAIPVAVFDIARISESLVVRHAGGGENYLSFTGETEHPQPGEVVFVDAAARVHARRWTNRQSAYSAVRDETATVLVVAEAMHAAASDDVPKVVAAIADGLAGSWPTAPTSAVLDSSARFTFDAALPH